MSKKLDYSTEDLNSLSVSELKKLTDYWLRQYLLKTAKRPTPGYIVCPIKDRVYPDKRMQVAHFIDRGVMKLRYDLRNCHLISEQSNMWDAQIPKEGFKSLHHYDYEKYLGEDLVKELKEESSEILIMYKDDYIEKIEFFRNEG